MENTKNYVVYCHQNKINGKKYFGATRQTPKTRWGYGRKYRESHPLFYEDIKKYSWYGFDHIILAEGLTKKQALNLERKLIFKYRSYNPLFGYNVYCQLAQIPIEHNINNDDVVLFNNWINLLFKIVK